ncbi:MAG: outer membrane lipoprotein carrier protein LolA [Bacteroidota bacterium]
MKRNWACEILFLFLFYFVAVSTLYSQDTLVAMTDSTGFKNKLEWSSKSTKSIQCDFVQEKNQNMLTEKIISKGHFWYKKPVCIRWEYTDPYSYLIIFTKNKVFIKDDGGKKQYETQSSEIFKELGVMMFNFLQGKISAFSKEYIITYMENEQSYYLKMIPKSAKLLEMLSQVDLYFDKKDLSVSKIKMIETEGDYTLLEFQNKKLNVEISDTVFTAK